MRMCGLEKCLCGSCLLGLLLAVIGPLGCSSEGERTPATVTEEAPSEDRPESHESVSVDEDRQETAVPALEASSLEQATDGVEARSPHRAEKSTLFKLRPVHGVMTKMVNYYRPERISLGSVPKEHLTAEPDYQSTSPLYGALQIGEGDDDTVMVVVDEVEGETPKIYIDRNNDEDLTNDGNGDWDQSSGSTLRLPNVAIDVAYPSGTAPYTLEFYRFTTRLRDTVLYYRNSGREGEITSGDQSYKVVVLDENTDGRFDDLENGTLLIDLNQDGKVVGTSDSAEHHKLNEPFNIHGTVWEVVSLSSDGAELRLRPSDASVEMRRYLEPGHEAPNFAAKGLDEQPIALAELAKRSKYILLDFWASWCGPCRAEYPHLRQLHARYKSHGLQILGVNLDNDRDKAVQAAEANLLSYPHVFDGKGWKNEVAILYRVHGIPQTYLLDQDLKIVAKSLRGEKLESRMAAILGPGDEETVAALAEEMSSKVAKQDARPPARPSVKSDPQASLGEGNVLYLACGPVGGPGKVYQVDGRGRLLSEVDLPGTPYGIDVRSNSLVVAIPRGGVMSIAEDGSVKQIPGGPLAQPIDIAVDRTTGCLLVADNRADILVRLPSDPERQPEVIQHLKGPERQLQNVSVAVAGDQQILFATDVPEGIFRLPPEGAGSNLGQPLVPADAELAADRASDRWAAIVRSGSVGIFEGTRNVAKVPIPEDRKSCRGKAIAFGADGTLISAQDSDKGTELAQVDIEAGVFRKLFVWKRERLVDLAVGPPMNWPGSSVKKVVNAAGNELRFVTFEPPLPHTFAVGERLFVKFAYKLESAEECRLFVRPFKGGSRAPGYGAHGSPQYSRGKGEAEGWFTFSAPAKIDQVRIEMDIRGETQQSSMELFVESDAEWK